MQSLALPVLASKSATQQDGQYGTPSSLYLCASVHRVTIPIFLLILLGVAMRRWFGLREDFWAQMKRSIHCVFKVNAGDNQQGIRTLVSIVCDIRTACYCASFFLRTIK